MDPQLCPHYAERRQPLGQHRCSFSSLAAFDVNDANEAKEMQLIRADQCDECDDIHHVLWEDALHDDTYIYICIYIWRSL